MLLGKSSMEKYWIKNLAIGAYWSWLHKTQMRRKIPISRVNFLHLSDTDKIRSLWNVYGFILNKSYLSKLLKNEKNWSLFNAGKIDGNSFG